MQAAEERAWERIAQAGEKVAYAYQHVLKAADELADLLEYNADHILREVLPKAVKERRDCERVLTWLHENQDGIEAHLEARQAAREAAARREALLAKLNLTVDEKQLLGIGRAR